MRGKFYFSFLLFFPTVFIYLIINASYLENIR